MGGSDNKPRLEGDRIAILSESQDYKPDVSLEGVSFALPAAEANESWMQSGGAGSSYVGHPALADGVGQAAGLP